MNNKMCQLELDQLLAAYEFEKEELEQALMESEAIDINSFASEHQRDQFLDNMEWERKRLVYVSQQITNINSLNN